MSPRTAARLGRGNVGHRAVRCGFTLLELTITLAVLAVVAAVALPSLQTDQVEQLHAAADLLAADLRLAQNLAIRDGDHYALTLSPDGWKLTYAGVGAAPTLPTPTLGGVGAGYQIQTSLLTGCSVVITGKTAQTKASVTGVTFTSTGRTTALEDISVWLTVGSGPNQRSVPLTVAVATGLVTVGSVISGPPI